MGTLVEEILSARLGRPVHAGEIVVVDVDYAMSHDTTSPLAIEAFRKLNRPLWDPSRIVIAIDHVVPASTPAVATTHRTIRQFTQDEGIANFFEAGSGICHQLMVEQGFVAPGSIVVQDAGLPIPAAGQARIKVAFCGVCGSDLHRFRGDLPLISVTPSSSTMPLATLSCASSTLWAAAGEYASATPFSLSCTLSTRTVRWRSRSGRFQPVSWRRVR